MTYSYKYYEAISFEATAFVGFPQIDPFVQILIFFTTAQWTYYAILISYWYSEL